MSRRDPVSRLLLALFVGAALLPLGASAVVAADAPIVTMGAYEPEKGPGRGSQQGSILLRELVRQAVLIAARDELGYRTRDQALREPFPKNATLVDISLSANRRGDSTTVELSLFAGDSPDLIFEKTLTLPANDRLPFDMGLAVTAIEPLSRKELVAALKKAGLADARAKPEADAAGAAAADVADAEKLLATTDPLSVFQAVRLGHRVLAADAGNPRALAVLVRGYALLGAESDFLWYAAAQAFHARALLYAERWVASAPESADARYHRAFARALAGMHAAAMTDLAAADKLLTADPAKEGDAKPAAGDAKPAAGETRPAWADLIMHLCKYDTAKLTAAMKENADPLAALLCFRTVRFADSDMVVIGTGRSCLEVSQSLSMIDRLCQASGVSGGHVFTEAGPAVLAGMTHARLKDAKDLPVTVKPLFADGPQKLAEPANVGVLVAGLVDAGATDASEPSWATAGKMIEDIAFVQTYRRTRFLVRSLGVGATDYVQSQQPACGKHPYWKMIVAMAEPERAKELLQDIVVLDVGLNHAPLASLLADSGPTMKDKGPWARVQFHMDPVANWLEQYLYMYRTNPGPWPSLYGENARAVSPYMPSGIAAELHGGLVEPTPARVAEIDAAHGDNPTVGAALIRYYLKKNDNVGAVKALDRFVKVAPEYWAFKELANIHERRGDEAKWLETMKRILEAPDYALTHAQTNAQIAYHYMRKRDYKTAEPYADEAATSFAAWALDCAIACKEKLGKFDEAEQMVVGRAQRYGEIDDWYMWCLRTGKGQVAQARQIALRYADALAGERDRESIVSRLSIDWASGKRLEGATIVKDHVIATGDCYAALLAAAAFDEAGQTADRDQMLLACSTRGRTHRVNDRVRTELVGLAKLWQESLTGKKPKLSPDKLIDTVRTAPPKQRFNGYYMAAQMLQRAGDTASAHRLLAMCLLDTWDESMKGSVGAFASAELRAAGIDANNLDALTAVAEGKAAAPAKK